MQPFRAKGFPYSTEDATKSRRHLGNFVQVPGLCLVAEAADVLGTKLADGSK